MKKIKNICFGLLLLFQSASGEFLSSGMSFLKLPSSGQSAATMTVFSQLGNAPLSIFENPVGITTSQTMVSLSHHIWIADVSIDALAISVPLKRSSLGIGLNYVRIPGIEIRDLPVDEPAAKIEPQYIAVAAGYSWSPGKLLQVGGSVKYLYEHLYTYTGKGLAFDIAGRRQFPGLLDLTITLQNVGFSNGDNSPLPTALTIGIVRPEIFANDTFNSAFGINLGSSLATGDFRAQTGIQVSYRNSLILRGGFERVGSVNRESLGFGIRLNQFSIDYAFLFMPEGFNHPHLITLSYLP